ncbi:hypothetical protein [Kribbella sp. NPDC000426]|uniref:hypothetical protein n=1 Tax=Kribbella sp. NPDC000426 TaxID=3154255 RepID=UPI003317A2E2
MSDLFGMITQQVHGSIATRYDQLYPGLEADGSVHFSSYDGAVAGPIAIRGATWSRELMSLDSLNLRVSQATDWRYFDVSLYVTDARIVIVVDKPIDARTKWVGHLRYPWLHSVGYRPRQGILYDCELVLGMEQLQEGREMPTDCTLRLLLDRHDDSAELAREIVRRLARHHLGRGTLPASAVPEFQVLLDPPRLPDPTKGTHATYWLGAFKHCPTGTEYVRGQPEQGIWRGSKV